MQQSGFSRFNHRCLILLFCLFTVGLPGWAQGLALGEIIEEVRCTAEKDKRYALYLPSKYNTDRKWPLLLLFEPAARAPLPLKVFKDAAENYGFIVACSYDTPNYRPWQVNWPGARAMWHDLLTRFSVDARRMYAGGLSGGARFASRVAFHTEQIQAVVLCGAGFWVRTQHAPKPNFEVVATVGATDFNYLELLDLEEELLESQLPNRRLLFAGGHHWPEPGLCDAALGWLQVRAFKKGLIPIEEVQASRQIERGVNAARSFEASDRPVPALASYKQVLEDFAGLADQEPADLDAARKAVARLENDKAYKSRLKEWQKAERKERKLRVEYVSRLTHGLNMAGSNPMGLRDELLWWKRELSQLSAMRNKPKNIADKEAGERLFNLLNANFYERNVYFFQDRSFDQARFINHLFEILLPDSPFPHYNLARAHAGKGDLDEALEALERAAAMGARLDDRFRDEPLFEPLKKDPRFQAILEKIEQNQKAADRGDSNR